MSIEKMQLVNIAGKLDSLDRVIAKCVESGCFHIESASSADFEDSGLSVLHEENPYRGILEKIVAVDLGSDFKFRRTDYSDIENESVESLSEYVSETSEKIRLLGEEISENRNSILQYE